jgi:hypothetical protein
MAGITTIFAHVRPDESAKACFESFRYLLTHSPLVANLAIYRDTTEEFPGDVWYPSLASIFPLRLNVSSPLALRSVELSSLGPGESSYALLQEVDMSRLGYLDIRDCSGRWPNITFCITTYHWLHIILAEVSPLLSTLSSLFSRTGSSLQILHVESDDPVTLVMTLDSWLHTWRGLRKLVLAILLYNDAPKTGIIHHRDTLTFLLLGEVDSNYQRQYNLNVIEILKNCPRVQEVGISLGPCDLGHWRDGAQAYHLETEDDKILPSSLEAVLVCEQSLVLANLGTDAA